jgi:hypothetical protein
VSAWRDTSAARDAAAAVNDGDDDADDYTTNLAAEAAALALDAILSLATPREEDDGFYNGDGFYDSGPGYWMDSVGRCRLTV